MLYNSDSYVVVRFEAAGEVTASAGDTGGYEIVDKFARKEIYLQGAMAEQFKLEVDALIESQPSEDEVDDYLERFTSLMQQPVVLH